MAEFIGGILHEPASFGTLGASVQRHGYSPYHFARCFRTLTGEAPARFARRIQMERSAFRLSQGATVGSVSEGQSAEAFSRAFRRAYGCSPRSFKASGRHWQISSPHDLHWLPEWDASLDWSTLRVRYPTKIERQNPLQLAVVRRVGNYAHLDEMWQSLRTLVSDHDRSQQRWVTIYHDSMYTAPRSDGMRADLGFFCPNEIPAGFTKLLIPGGLVVKTDGFVPRNKRDEAWRYLTAQWTHSWSWDEYSSWPLPFEKVETRICMRPD